MNNVLIVLASSTTAYSVKTALEKRYKIYSKIVKSPSRLSTLGCSYCLEIKREDLKYALDIIDFSQISFRGAYDSKTYERLDIR